VTVLEGDVGDAAAVARAAAGCQKVIFCARARSALAADLANVEKAGVNNCIKALLDAGNARALASGAQRGPRNKVTLARFRAPAALRDWAPDALDGAGLALAPSGELGGGESRVGGMGRRSSLAQPEQAQPASAAQLAPEGALRWSGAVQSLGLRGGEAQLSGPLDYVPPAGFSLADCDGLVLRVRGDGKRYSALLATRAAPGEALQWYAAPFLARPAWAPLRLPFAAFRPLAGDAPPLAPERVARLGFRFELKAQARKAEAAPSAAAAAAAAAAPAPPPRRGRRAVDADAEFRAALERQAAAAVGTAGTGRAPPPLKPEDDPGAFRLEVSFVKALPGGTEPDLVLVSCAGGGLDAEEAEKVVPVKRAAEALVRNSGLGYTIVRPGPLLEAPGGARALLFDQGGRITEGITCADVADVCVRSLHDEEARNRSFDVCHEYSDAGGSRFELVAHVPTTKSVSYLTPALKTLEKNT